MKLNEQKRGRRTEAPDLNTNDRSPASPSIEDVNFDEMNFEQRRAPYNSGKRNLAEREYHSSRGKKDSERSSRNQ